MLEEQLRKMVGDHGMAAVLTALAGIAPERFVRERLEAAVEDLELNA